MAGTDTKNPKKIERTPDGTIELRLTLPWALVKKQREVVIEEMAKATDVPGFRKGKAPKKLVEQKVDETRVRDEIIRTLLPRVYMEAITQNNIKPIMDPQIHIETALEDGKDWQFHALTAELPEVDLGAYKEAVKKITAKSKIQVPGKETEAPKMDEIIKALLDSSNVTIPSVLVTKEADRLISQTLDEIKRLGMTLDQYLSSTGKTPETLRAEYAKKAQNDLKLEFVLQKVAEQEKITVEEAEIQKTIDNAKPEEKQSLTANKYLLASIIRQQKTLDFLRSL